MNRKIIALGALALPLVPGGVALAGAVPASGATASVVVNGNCSGTSLDNLQLQKESPTKVSVDFGVDMARHTAGVPWKITETNNGTTFVNTTKLTISDGSFSITRTVAAQAGGNTIVGHATNTRTGETCSLSAKI